MDNDAKTMAAFGFVDSRLNSLLKALKQHGTKEASTPSTTPSRASPQSSAHLGASITFTGDVSGEEDLFVTGTIDGSIALQGSNATVEQSGNVGGRIRARQVRIKGTVVGDVEAQEKITIGSTGKVEGKIIAPRIAVEDGAIFNGLVDLSSGGAASAHRDQQDERLDPLKVVNGHTRRGAARHRRTGTR